MVAAGRAAWRDTLRDLPPAASHRRGRRVDVGADASAASTTSADALPAELSHGPAQAGRRGARAGAQRPRWCCLDEPAAGLDTDESARARAPAARAARRRRDACCSIDHDMGLVLSVCDQVMVLDFGKVIARGTPAEIRA